MKLLVVKPTALGDVAQALTVAPLLKQRAAWLAWLVDEDYAPLVKLCPWVDEIITFPRRRLRGSPSAWVRWLASLRRHEFDVALDLQGLARSALMLRAVRADWRVGLRSAREGARLAYNVAVADGQRHAIDRYLAAARLVAGLDAAAPADRPLLAPPPDAVPAGLRAGEYTVLHPYSLWATKLWPWRNYERLAALLPQEQFVLAGQGPFFPASAPNITDCRNRTGLTDLLALLGGSRAVIGTDSGPLHLAAAFGKPLLALFGATDPGKTAPRAPLTVAKILTAGLSCQPCLRRHCQRPAAMECLRVITPEQVAKAWVTLVTKM
ncbi:MAG: glycosyltransferase family 9 protein [Verrucomicrobiales bacterium]|jgi:ADP-heptose:LPS heptosyltransferase|nr:glycosyltransferase family 9 protein [Verrucomicrobiales bacterium]